ncbi:transmembrane protein, putative, partial [Bodo saltans]
MSALRGANLTSWSILALAIFAIYFSLDEHATHIWRHPLLNTTDTNDSVDSSGRRDSEPEQHETAGQGKNKTIERNDDWTASQALRRFEDRCVEVLPLLFTPSRRNATVFQSTMNQTLIYEPRTVCISRDVTIYRYQGGSHLGTRKFRHHLQLEQKSRVDFRRRRASFIGNASELEDALSSAHRRDHSSIVWHHSLGVMMASVVDQHPYHFMMDGALQALSVTTDEDVRQGRYEPLRISSGVLNERYHWNDTGLWPVTERLVAPLLKMPSVSANETYLNFNNEQGSSDGNMHCYCQAVVAHGHYERDRNRFLDPRACEKDPSDGPCQMFLVLRKRLQRHFGLVPFGETAPL